MTYMINVLAARQTLIACVNAIMLVLAGLGKLSHDAIGVWTEQVGNIFDYAVLIFGCIAIVLPRVGNRVKLVNGSSTLSLLAFGLVAATVALTGCAEKSRLSKICTVGPDGTEQCYPNPFVPPAPVPASSAALLPSTAPPPATAQLAK